MNNATITLAAMAALATGGAEVHVPRRMHEWIAMPAGPRRRYRARPTRPHRLHPAARMSTETVAEHRARKNAMKRARRERRRG